MSRAKLARDDAPASRNASLGIVQTHATQFNGPLFRHLATLDWLDLTVYFTWRLGNSLGSIKASVPNVESRRNNAHRKLVQ